MGLSEHNDVLTVSVPYDFYLGPLRERAERGELGPVRLVHWDVAGDPADGVDCADLDVVIIPFHTQNFPPSPGYVSTQNLGERLALARNARYVLAPSIGVEGLIECIPEGAVLANAVGVMEPPTAELAVTLLLAVLRDLPAFFRAREWNNYRTRGLYGSRVILLGYGGVGRAAAARMAPFGAEIIPVASSARIGEHGERVHGINELHDLVRDADAVLCTLPLNESTRGLLDAEFFAALNPGTAFVNIGRGAVVDTEALRAAAAAGQIRAAVDVTDPEPLPAGHPLWDTPNLVVTPHVGGNSDAAVSLQIELLADQITRLNRGESPHNPVPRPAQPAALLTGG